MSAKHLWLICLVLPFTVAGPAGADICAVVDPSNIDCSDGRCSLAAALSHAATRQEANVIKVVRGVHNASSAAFSFNSSRGFSVRVEGGYNSTCTSRIVDPANTIIQGGGGNDTLTILQTNGGSIWVEALTVRNGNKSNRAAVHLKTSTGGITNSDITIYHCIVENNQGGDAFGASGVWVESHGMVGAPRGGSVTIKDNIIRNNAPWGGLNVWSHSNEGDSGDITVEGNLIQNNERDSTVGAGRAGLVTEGPSPQSGGNAGQIRVTNNEFRGNRSAVNGGGLRVHSNPRNGDGGAIHVAHNVFRSNETWGGFGGGGVFLDAPTGTAPGRTGSVVSLINNLIAENSSRNYGGGAFLACSSPTPTGGEGARYLVNNTIAGNEAGTQCTGVLCSSNGILIELRQTSQVEMHNNIVRGNDRANGEDIYFHARAQGGEVSLTHNNYARINEEGLITKSNNLNVAPGYVGGGDYRLTAGSPCIDVGWNDAPRLPANDLDGKARIIDGNQSGTVIVDMGAYEYGVGEVQYKSYFAQWGNGRAGQVYLFSRLELVNLDPGRAASAEVEVTDGSGIPIRVEFDTSVEIPAGGAVSLATSGQGAVRVGSVTVTSSGPVAGTIVFGGSAGLAGVPQSRPLRACVSPVRMDSASNLVTGVAIMSMGQAATVQFELRDQQGSLVATAAESLGPRGHKALGLDQLRWSRTVSWASFSGTLKMTSSAHFGATIIMYTPGQYATLPVIEIE